MSLSAQLYKGQKINFTAIDPDKDPPKVAAWTRNAGYMRMMYTEPMRPQSPSEIKKKLETIEKDCEDEKGLYHFQVHRTNDDLLIGFCQIENISWSNRNASIQVGIGDPSNHRKGYGSEMVAMVLDICFSELNLERVSAFIPEYNTAAIDLFEKHGFVLEGRRREAIYRDLRYWDMLIFGLVRELR